MKDKIKILARLIKEGQITIDEFVLLTEPEIKYIQGYQMPYQNPYNYPYTVTSSTGLFGTQDKNSITFASQVPLSATSCACNSDCTCSSKN